MMPSPQLPISSSGTESLIFAIAFFVWITSEIIGAMILPRHHRAGTKLEIKDRRSGLVMIVGLIAAIYLAFGLSLAGIVLLPGWLFFPMIALMVLGFFLRQWSTSAPRLALLPRDCAHGPGVLPPAVVH
jgi:hypothetical protein